MIHCISLIGRRNFAVGCCSFSARSRELKRYLRLPRFSDTLLAVQLRLKLIVIESACAILAGPLQNLSRLDAKRYFRLMMRVNVTWNNSIPSSLLVGHKIDQLNS